MPNLVSLTCLSLQLLCKTHTGVSNFRISDQSFINGNRHNSKTSHDIDMKFRSVTKLDKRSMATSKNCDDDVITIMSMSFLVNFMVSFYG